ncbi:hypothetical protein DPEC_G00095580 [Dallia pectoralis]|uniref:Uncharacterized protein n=1 Tax=Dallia pectoralis TaxID=75939 RepID=A0ACC2GVK6_DALPE|nr:hypothetical protein DPEC_G00095580 [Dallia pectoralis]
MAAFKEFLCVGVAVTVPRGTLRRTSDWPEAGGLWKQLCPLNVGLWVPVSVFPLTDGSAWSHSEQGERTNAHVAFNEGKMSSNESIHPNRHVFMLEKAVFEPCPEGLFLQHSDMRGALELSLPSASLRATMQSYW